MNPSTAAYLNCDLKYDIIQWCMCYALISAYNYDSSIIVYMKIVRRTILLYTTIYYFDMIPVNLS